MLRPIYDWLLRQAASRNAPFALAFLAFAEAVFLPVPPDVMLAPMVVAKPDRIWRYALLTTLCSVAGGCVSYTIGYYFVDLATQILSWRSHITLTQYKQFFHQWGALLILAKGLTPIPYMIVTYASGLAQFSFWQFVAASLVTRGCRFCLTAWLSKKFGPQMQKQIEKNLLLWTTLLVVVAGLLIWAIHKIS